jgi:hypothetical protein
VPFEKSIDNDILLAFKFESMTNKSGTSTSIVDNPTSYENESAANLQEGEVADSLTNNTSTTFLNSNATSSSSS